MVLGIPFAFWKVCWLLLEVGVQAPCMAGSEEEMTDSGNLTPTKDTADTGHTAEDWTLGED